MIERAPAPRYAPPRADATYVVTGSRSRFMWTHPPAIPSTTGIGLVIVPPFGYEAVCAHRALRHLAEDAAKAGLLAVRVDLDGTGNSSGDDLDPGRLDAWLASVDDACNLARARGANRVVLCGVRLGASLAVLAAGKRAGIGDVVGVVAIAAVPSGKALVREGRALQMQLGLAEPPAGAAVPQINGEDVHELVGYALTGETRAALSAIDLTKAPKPAPSLLVIDRDDLPANDKWATALRAAGAEVEQQRLPGYVEMMLDPHRTQVPQQMIDATIAYTLARPRVEAATPPAIDVKTTGVAGAIGEELVHLDHHLVAIQSRRLVDAPSGRAVILLNSGSIHHVGPNRLYVQLARRLAARGDLVLRVDLSGIGDSLTRPGATENTVYSEHAVADVGVAVAWARRQGARSVAVGGVCSGAYHALKAAVDAQLIDTIVPINPLTFFYKPGMPLDFAAFRVVTDSARYQKSMTNIASWGKLLRGEVNVARVARVVAERTRSVAEHRAREVARRLRVPLREDLATDLLALGRSDVRMRFIFAHGDPGHAMLLEQGGSAIHRLRASGKLTIDVIGGPDHTFTPRWSHPLFLAAFERAVT